VADESWVGGKASIGNASFQSFGDVGAPALDKGICEAFSRFLPLGAEDVRKPHETGIEESELPVEGCVVSAVRGSGQQDEVARGGCREALEQLLARVLSMACGRAGVRLVDNDELWTCAEEMILPLAALDVVEADDRVGVYREDADSWGMLCSSRRMPRAVTVTLRIWRLR
jgi:hypothetical protein